MSFLDTLAFFRLDGEDSNFDSDSFYGRAARQNTNKARIATANARE